MKPAGLIFFLAAALVLAACTARAALSTLGAAVTPAASIPVIATQIQTLANTSTPTLTPLAPALEPTRASLPTATPIPACRSSGGVMVLASLESHSLRRPMDYRVFLPPCYYEDPGKRYPVLYLIHGQSYNPDQWDRLGADDAAARLYADGELPPFLIVMPGDTQWTEPEVDPFGDVVLEELIPLIDSEYRTLPEARYRAIGGLSRGGAWAIHLGLHHPDLFGAVGAHSAVVFWSDTGSLRKKLAAVPADQLPRIYIDDGDKDRWIESAIWFERLLTELKIPHEWYLFTGYHEEKYWKMHVEDYLRFYASGWTE